MTVYKDEVKDKAIRVAKPTQYVMYEKDNFKNMTVLDEKPILINSDKYKVVENKVYTTQSSCRLDPPDLDPTPSKGVIPWGISKVKALEAQSVNDARNVVVCVADTGVAPHPDIPLVGEYNAVSSQPTTGDPNGHGTHVAGTISAINNEHFVVGVSQAPIFSSRVLDSWGSGRSADIARGIAACVDKGNAKVINLSLGSPARYGVDELIYESIQYAHNKGAITVCANGNDGGDVGYPAKYCKYAVAASDSRDRIASFSSRGPETDVIAPGVDIVSTSNKGGTEIMSGTSMATPHVSGAIALMLAQGRMMLGVDDIGLSKDEQGRGRLNALETVK